MPPTNIYNSMHAHTGSSLQEKCVRTKKLQVDCETFYHIDGFLYVSSKGRLRVLKV